MDERVQDKFICLYINQIKTANKFQGQHHSPFIRATKMYINCSHNDETLHLNMHVDEYIPHILNQKSLESLKQW